jgi:hypothetical protein
MQHTAAINDVRQGELSLLTLGSVTDYGVHLHMHASLMLSDNDISQGMHMLSV